MSPFERGRLDCTQDGFENCPFASIGGLDRRKAMVIPQYISTGGAEEYLRGYRAVALETYGPEWETVSFQWVHAFTIPATE